MAFGFISGFVDGWMDGKKEGTKEGRKVTDEDNGSRDNKASRPSQWRLD
jgi:hypothetical protein